VLVEKSSIGLEHPSVQSVIEIAQEIISENKVLDTEILYNTAKNRLKIPRRGLLRIIQFLINQRILVEGTKCTRNTVLLNPHRNKIYRFIRSHLGVHFSIIRDVLFSDHDGKSQRTGQLVWHLEALIKFGYIKKVKFKNYAIFIPSEIDDENGIIYFLLRDRLNKKIINLLIERSLVKKSAIHKELNEQREIINYRVKDLMTYNILSQIKEGDNKIGLNQKSKDKIIQVFNDVSKFRKSEGNI